MEEFAYIIDDVQKPHKLHPDLTQALYYESDGSKIHSSSFKALMREFLFQRFPLQDKDGNALRDKLVNAVCEEYRKIIRMAEMADYNHKLTNEAYKEQQLEAIVRAIIKVKTDLVLKTEDLLSRNLLFQMLNSLMEKI